MGQAEVILCLNKHEKPISRRQISEELKDDVIKISHIIRKLLKKGEIKCIELDRIQSGKMLGLNRIFRRTRFYYV